MSIEKVRKEFEALGIADRILEFEISSATVELAAVAVGVIPARIAKTLSFMVNGNAVLVVTAGDAKVDNKKFKSFFGTKAKMLTPDEVDSLIGHSIGGVCPFAINPDIEVYLDISMERFESVFPACGSSNSAIEFTPQELFKYSKAKSWIDVCKAWQEEQEVL